MKSFLTKIKFDEIILKIKYCHSEDELKSIIIKNYLVSYERYYWQHILKKIIHLNEYNYEKITNFLSKFNIGIYECFLSHDNIFFHIYLRIHYIPISPEVFYLSNFRFHYNVNYEKFFEQGKYRKFSSDIEI